MKYCWIWIVDSIIPLAEEDLGSLGWPGATAHILVQDQLAYSLPPFGDFIAEFSDIVPNEVVVHRSTSEATTPVPVIGKRLIYHILFEMAENLFVNFLLVFYSSSF
jgi:hypothetical protein